MNQKLIPISEAVKKIRGVGSVIRKGGKDERRRSISMPTLRRWAERGFITSNYDLVKAKKTDMLRIDWHEAYRLIGSKSALIKPGRKLFDVPINTKKVLPQAASIKELASMGIVAMSTIYAWIAEPPGSCNRLDSIRIGANLVIDYRNLRGLLIRKKLTTKAEFTLLWEQVLARREQKPAEK